MVKIPDDQELIEEVAELVGMTGRENGRISGFSKGMLYRVLGK
ncbi:hypothetical protein [Radiobacillus deserti]|nr:hypothetical protein [Radiobacillus deserti]